MELNQNLADFFPNNKQGSGGESPKPSVSSGGLSLDLANFFPSQQAAPRQAASGTSLDPDRVNSIADAEGLSPTQRRVMTALLHQESGFGRNARTSVDGAQGPGQIIPATFRRYAKAGEDIGNADHNLAVMARIVKDLGTKFGDDPGRIATGYFSGEGNVNRGSGQAWRNDAADGNRKRVSSYVSDILTRLSGVSDAQASEKPAASKAELPDLGKAKPWAEIAKNPEYQALDTATKAQAKAAYFDYWIAPHAGGNASQMREKFLGMKDPTPGLMERAGEMVGKVGDAIKGVMPGLNGTAQGPATEPSAEELEQASKPAFNYRKPGGRTPAARDPNAIDMPGSVMDGTVPQDNTLPTTSKAPVRPEVRAAFNAQWDAATPEQRAAMAKQEGVMGQLARDRAGVFARQDEIAKGMPADNALRDVDPRIEARRAELIANGEDARVADTLARVASGRGVLPGQEIAAVGVMQDGSGTRQGQIMQMQADLQNAPQGDKPEGAEVATNAIMRGIHQGAGMLSGIAALGAKAVGAEDLALTMLKGYFQSSAKAKQYSAQIEDFTKIEKLSDVPTYVLEGVLENLPQLAVTIGTGSVGGLLARKFGEKAVAKMVAEQAAKELSRRTAIGAAAGAGVSSIGMESGSIYGDIARETGQERPGVAASLGAVAGALDAIPAFRAATKILGKESVSWATKDIAKRYGKEALVQLGGEGFTEFLQTWVEKGAVSYVDGRPLFTKENLVEAVDAFLKGGAAGAVIGVGSQGVADIRNAPNIRAERDAEAARTAALNKWNTQGFVQPGRTEPTISAPAENLTEGGRIEPTMGALPPNVEVAPSEIAPVDINPMVQTADSIVSELASQAGVPLSTVLPTQATPQQTTGPQSLSDEDIINRAEMRVAELWQKSSEGGGITPAEQQELDALTQAEGNPAALRKLYGFDQASSTDIRSDASANQTFGQTPAPVPGQAEQPTAGQQFPATMEPGLVAAQSQENANVQTQINAQQDGLAQPAVGSDGQPGGPAPVQEPAAQAPGSQVGAEGGQRYEGLPAEGAVSPQSVAIQAAQISRRESPLSVDPRVDRIGAQENYLQELARSNPEAARSIAQELRNDPQKYSEAAGVSPEMIGRYASIIEQQLSSSKPRTEKEARAQRAQQKEATNGTQAPEAQQAEAQGRQPEQAPAAAAVAPKTEKEARAKKAEAQKTAVRDMTDEGRAKDGKPINGGDVFRTSSGRETTPYPKQKQDRYASQWLIDNAVAEAEARGDSFNAGPFKSTKPSKGGTLTTADRDSMLMYLFGEQPAVQPSILKPLTDKPAVSANTAVAPKTEREAREQRRKTNILTPDGGKVEAQWDVVDADSVKASLKEGVSQPRDRTRAASNKQVLEIANKPDFERLSDTSKTMDYGAPTLSADGLIVGGNGRFEGVSQAYEGGKAAEYLDALLKSAPRFGLDADAIRGMKKPILVRRITQEADTRKLAIQSNQAAGLQMSDMEQAALDAERMTDLDRIEVSENGDIPLTTANVGSIRDALSGYNTNELAAMMAADGTLSQSGVRRVRNAILYSAYGKSDSLSRLIESPDADMKNIGTALVRAGAQLAKVRRAIADGNIPANYDIAADLTAAIETLSSLRASGTNLADYLAQNDMFGGGISDEAKTIIQFLNDNLRSAKSISEYLNAYAQAVLTAESASGGLFGDVALPSKQEVLQNAGQRFAAEKAAAKSQQSIFDQPTGEIGKQDRQRSEGQAGDARSNEEGAGQEVTKVEKPLELNSGFFRGATMREKVLSAFEYARKKFAQAVVKNTSDGNDIIIPASGIKHALSGSVSPLSLAAVGRLDEIISGSTFVSAEPDKQGRNTIKEIRFYERNVSMDGEPRKLRIVVRVAADGSRYYDHFEAQEKAPVGQPGKQAMPDSTQPFAGAVSSEPDTPKSIPDTLDQAKEKYAKKVEKNANNKNELSNSVTITDFGQKIGGAKKDLWGTFSANMAKVSDDDIGNQPLSKSWPEPDYQAMLDSGADKWAVAFMHATRDAIPAKPRQGYKLRTWTSLVQGLRQTAIDLASGKISIDRAKAVLDEMGKSSSVVRDIAGRIDLYQAVGHSKSLSGVRISVGEYSIYEGVEYKPAKIIWSVEKQAAATAFSNWPRMLATGSTRAEAIQNFKEKFDSLTISQPASKEISFDIWSTRGQEGYMVGKKVGRNYIELAGPFATIKEAREYRTKNQAELVAKLEKAKEIPRERRDTNNPRVGEDMRGGHDVTPAMFGEAFGFRGVEFGNWVDQAKRQKDLNEAYDALMDMAAIIGVSPKALSLNGELGIAFGARGSGGVNPAAAHYEPGYVVINLTKKSGAGSLGHEWWHALDNYFSRMRKQGDKMMTDALDVSLASRGSNFEHRGEVRKEMIDAFGQVMKAIRTTAIRARSAKLDAKRTKEYWTTSPEMSARAFESYLISKLQDQNASNDYLANIVDEKTWEAAEKLGFELDGSYPYPTAGEVPAIRAGFDAFFDAIEQKKTDSGVMLYEPPTEYGGEKATGDVRESDYTDPYANTETRPGTTDKQREVGRDALADLERRLGLDRVSARNLASGSKASVLGNRMLANFQAGKPNQLTGQVASTPDDLAVLAQVYRDPRFETFRVVYMDGNKIIGEAGYTSRLPGAVTLPNAIDEKIEAEMRRFGADGYYIMHNHPSGRAMPSKADERLTVAIANSTPGFRGHVVIDSNEYATVDGKGNSRVVKADLNAVDFTSKPAVPHKLLGEQIDGPLTVARLARQLQIPQGHATLILTERSGKVQLLVDVPMGALSDQSRQGVLKGKALIRRMARDTGSGGYRFIVLPEGVNVKQLGDWVREGVFTDVVSASGESFLGLTVSSVRPDFIDEGGRAMEVREPGQKQTYTPEFKRWFGDSKVVDENGRPLVVYHGSTARGVTVFDTTRVTTRSARGDVAGTYFTADPRSASGYTRSAGATIRAPRGEVVAAYLKIDNPLNTTAAIKKYQKQGMSFGDAKRKALEALTPENDGIIFDGDGVNPSEYVVFSPTQIKSATGNNGQFDPANPSIVAEGAPPPYQPGLPLNGGQGGTSWQIGDSGRKDNFVYKWLDKNVDLKQVQQAIKENVNIIEQFDAYQREELYHGRVADRSKKFQERELRPLLMDMKLKGIALDKLEAYLWARHAPERNAQIARINDDMPDGGSGLTNAQVRQYFDGKDVLDASGEVIIEGLRPEDRRSLEALAARVDAINAGTKQVLLQYGLETPATIQAWEGTYSNYVPLHREDMDGSTPIGQGYSVKGSSSKRATGSRLKVVDIIGNIALQREAAITRGEKNRVGLALYGLALQNPNKDFWDTDRQPMISTIDKDTGMVHRIPDPKYKNEPNVLIVRMGGHDRAVVFNKNNDRAMRMAESLKNLDVTTLDESTAIVAVATRYFAAINTQYNPVFGMINGIRDVQAAALNLSSTELRGKQAQMLVNVPSALRAIWGVERGDEANSDMARLYEEMRAAGGTTGYRDIFRLGKDRTDALIKEIEKLDSGTSMKVIYATLDVLDAYNTAIENATRLAAYKVAKDAGMSQQKAASIAKNITVNFNRKGKSSRSWNGWYAFFNSAVQGTARTWETLTSPAGKKIMAGGLAIGVLQALAPMIMGMDDDDWEAIPDFIKQRNLIIPTTGGRYVQIPMPLGFNIIPNIGRITTELFLSGGKNPGKKALELATVFLDNASPLGSSTFAQTVVPTIADPIVALAENKNFDGRRIYKENMGGREKPGFTRAKDSSSAVSRYMAEGINTLTGGDKYKPGMLSPTPDQLDYIFGTLTGGVGREMLKAYQAAELTAKGERVPLHRRPVVGRFYGSTDEDVSQASRYYRNMNELNTLEDGIKGRRRDRLDVEAFRRENPESSMIARSNAFERQVNKLRRERHDVEFDDKMQESERTARLKELDARIQAKMREFNQEYAASKKNR